MSLLLGKAYVCEKHNLPIAMYFMQNLVLNLFSYACRQNTFLSDSLSELMLREIASCKMTAFPVTANSVLLIFNFYNINDESTEFSDMVTPHHV